MRNPTRQENRELHEVQFVGVDGEGVTLPDGSHHYVLLSVGDHSLERGGKHLHHDEIFEFLYYEFLDNPEAAYVGFFLGYDFTQWLKTIAEQRARRLLSPQGIASRLPTGNTGRVAPFMVQLGQEWEIDLLGHKRFKLRPFTPRGAKPEPTMYVCDAGPFFQTSLLNVLDPAGWPKSDYPISRADYDIILEGKSRRSTAEFDHAMIRYNVTENRALSQVMGHLNAGFVSAGVRLKKNQWFGPGQAASAWLNEHCNHTATEVRDVTPNEVLLAAQGSYYGGWFEIFAHGHVPEVSYEYDINSAYPYCIAKLPCLLHGVWRHSSVASTPWALSYCEPRTDNRILGSLACRSTDGNIFRPSRPTGWYWQHEIDALKSIPGVYVEHRQKSQCWSYEPCDCPPPMRDVEELYQQRIALGTQGKNSPQGKALKLLYNSMYGKFAQSVGSPKHANPIWASLITSLTRTELLTAIGTHPHGVDDLLMVATDAVYFRSPHPGLHLSKTDLGAWDETTKRNLTLMMPGVYWDDNTRIAFKAGKAPKLKSRGISASALAACITQIDDLFTSFDPTRTAALTEPDWPTASIPLPFTMTSATLAVARHKWHTAGEVSTDSVRSLSSWPAHKRNPADTWWDRGVLRTARYDATWTSVPYKKDFGMKLHSTVDTDEMLSPDGDLTTLLRDAFQA